MRRTRTFIAVVAEGEVHAAALGAIDRLRSAAENVKWVAPENLHWTLQFLGDLDDVEVAEVCRRVVQTAAELPPLQLSAAGVGAFPDIDRPRTLWLGAEQGSEAFCQLQARIADQLDDLGFRREKRRFVPHLTLGRVGRGSHGGPVLAKRLHRLADYQAGGMEVAETTVFASRLQRDGPQYHVLATAPLKGD